MKIDMPKNWKEEFGERFGDKLSGFYYGVGPEEIEDFIETQIAQAEKRGEERIQALWDKETDELYEMMTGMKEMADDVVEKMKPANSISSL